MQNYLANDNNNTFIRFYADYANINSLTSTDSLNKDYKTIIVIGLKQAQSNSVTFGTILGFTSSYKMATGLPAMCFINTGLMDSLYNVQNLTEPERKQVITIVTAHEICHGRGLSDKNGSNYQCIDNVHDNHTIGGGWVTNCVMSCMIDAGGTIQYRYPVKMCPKHVNNMRDSLKDKIKSYLIY